MVFVEWKDPETIDHLQWLSGETYHGVKM
jgi:hypothetical protein